MVNNIELFKDFLNGCAEGEFYTIQILKRGKDEGGKGVKTLKTYYASSYEYLERKMDEIIELCDRKNARAYINLNKKSWKQVSLKSLTILANSIANESYRDLLSLVDSACGQTGACDKFATWLVDIDTTDTSYVDHIEEIIKSVNGCEGERIILRVPTAHGWHLITRPFMVAQFKDIYKQQIDIHKNSPTLLYYGG